MTADLTFAEINTQLNDSAFSFDNGDILLSVSKITGDTYTGLTDTGIVEFCFKLLKLFQEAQTTKNTTTPNSLTSFTAPFYNSVSDGNPPIIRGSITVSASIPLNVDNLIGTN